MKPRAHAAASLRDIRLGVGGARTREDLASALYLLAATLRPQARPSPVV